MNDDPRSKQIFGALIAQFPGVVQSAQKTLLADMLRLADAKEHALQSEFDRKTRKFGKDSNEVKTMEATIAAEKLLHNELREQAQRSETTTSDE